MWHYSMQRFNVIIYTLNKFRAPVIIKGLGFTGFLHLKGSGFGFSQVHCVWFKGAMCCLRNHLSFYSTCDFLVPQENHEFHC